LYETTFSTRELRKTRIEGGYKPKACYWLLPRNARKIKQIKAKQKRKKKRKRKEKEKKAKRKRKGKGQQKQKEDRREEKDTSFATLHPFS